MNQNNEEFLVLQRIPRLKVARTNKDLDGNYKETRTMPKFSVYANQPEEDGSHRLTWMLYRATLGKIRTMVLDSASQI
jgi:hypothetical protein